MRFAGMLAASLLFPAAAIAAQFPDRPIRLIVPFEAGGTASLLARAIAAGAEKDLGTIVIDNRGGANGIIGTQMVVNANPDGYTLLHVSTSIAINPSVYRKLPYDTMRDLAPITFVALGSGYVVLAGNNFPAKNIKDLIDTARGGKIAYSSGGIGNSTHLIAEMFSRAAGVTMTHVPYKGVAPAITALLTGEVPIMFIPPTAAVPLVKSGKLRALAFTGKQRWSVLPDVPTIMESGLPGFHKDSGWNAWLAPAKTPTAILERLQNAVHASVHSPKVSAWLNAGGYDPLGNTPAEARRFLAEEIELYAQIVKAVGLEAQ